MTTTATFPPVLSSPKGHVSAFGFAVVAEGILLLALILMSQLGWWQKEPPVKEIMKLDLTEVPPQPKPPEPPKVQPPTPHPVSAAPRPVTPPTVQPLPPLVKSTEPSPFVEKPVVQPPPQPAPNPDKSAAEIATYAGQIRAAVQSALIYPQAAQAMNYSGRVRVEFNLVDKQPSAAKILLSSKVGLFDRAALAAVLSASYPAPPAALSGQQKTYQVWVEFNR